MNRLLATSDYTRILLIDTQVILETKPLEQLPWTEFGEEPILLLICRQVQSEIDAKKSDSRLGKRSREFNKFLDAFLETRTPVTLVNGTPRIDVALVSNVRIDWTSLDELDPDDGDDKIIGQALNALIDDRSRIEVLSHDMRPRDAAFTHGLRALKLPEHWMRDPEPSSDSRARSRLEEEVRLLRSDQPIMNVRVEAVTNAPWKTVSIAQPEIKQFDLIKNSILFKSPRQETDSYFPRDYSFDDRHRKWRDRLLNTELPAMHLGLQRLHAQHRIFVTVENVGSITAEGLSLEIRSGNTILHTIPYDVLIFGSPAPYPRYFHDPMPHVNFDQLRPPTRHEPFTFYLEEKGPGKAVNWSCSSFRQEKSFSVELSVELTNESVSKAQIEAVVTAQNMKGDKRAQLLVDIIEEFLPFGDAVNPAKQQISVKPTFDASENFTKAGEVRLFRNDGSVARDD